jgi:hypothetical protein
VFFRCLGCFSGLFLVLFWWFSATVLLGRVGACGWCEGRFWACISAPFGMNGVVSGAFSGSFRVVEGFSGSDV